MADIAIVLAIAAGAFAGWRKGFILPLVAQGGALLALAFVYAGPAAGAVPSGEAGMGVGILAMVAGGTILGRVGGTLVGLVQRFSALRAFDRVAGVPLGAATAAVTLYVALIGTLAVDGWLNPLHGKSAIGEQDVAAVQALAAVNPALGVFADPNMLRTLAETAKASPVASEQLAQFSSTLALYEGTVRPELLRSRIAPLLLAVGERLPIVGRPAQLPTE